MDIASLFQPDVPGRANIGKLGDLFAAQAWSSPAQTGRQSNISGRQMRSLFA
jgi:hypothetical protein